MNGFNKEFGKFTLRKLSSREFCNFDKKEKCRNLVSIYSEQCKKCFEEKEKEKNENSVR